MGVKHMVREYIRDDSKPFVASQSGIRAVTDCERMAHHRYVLRTPNDSDYVSPAYFRFGSALHKLLEMSQHNIGLTTPEHYEGVCMEFKLDWQKDGAKLVAMLRAYAKVRDYAETILGLEVEAVSDNWLMYADMVVRTPEGWKIVDIKTTSDFDPAIKSKMRFDNQVNLYTAHAHLFAEKLGISTQDFLGFEYREISKPRERLKKSETREELIDRMQSQVRYTLMSPGELQTAPVVEQMETRLERLRQLFGGATPSENRTQCVGKGQSCPYYSQCNGGKTYTEAKAEGGEQNVDESF
jgi:hypothetical protein